VPVETIFLDAGGVLLHPNWDRVAETLGRQRLTATAAALMAADPRARFELDTPARIDGRSDASRARLYFDIVWRNAGIRAAPAALEAVWRELSEYHARHNLWEHVPAEIREVLARWRRSGFRLVIVSNSNGTLRAHLRRLGLDQLVDLVIDSHEEGVEKPDPRLFTIALQRAGARPETTTHVGDLYHVDVVGARAAGLRPVLFDPAGLYADPGCARISSLAALESVFE
jgi:putative hydrolase of the HAD superfamily